MCEIAKNAIEDAFDSCCETFEEFTIKEVCDRARAFAGEDVYIAFSRGSDPGRSATYVSLARFRDRCDPEWIMRSMKMDEHQIYVFTKIQTTPSGKWINEFR